MPSRIECSLSMHRIVVPFSDDAVWRYDLRRRGRTKSAASANGTITSKVLPLPSTDLMPIS